MRLKFLSVSEIVLTVFEENLKDETFWGFFLVYFAAAAAAVASTTTSEYALESHHQDGKDDYAAQIPERFFQFQDLELATSDLAECLEEYERRGHSFFSQHPYVSL